MTVVLVYGLATLVYQNGILSFTTIKPLSPCGEKGVCWIPPILAFFLILGLSLDYDVFIVSRMLEARMVGFDDKDSIVQGLVLSGGIVTSAGIIMTLAFLGMMLAHEPVINQMSFLLALAVLVDTFVIRSLLVPAVMSIIGRWNWWPRKVPDAFRKI